jgi:siroheme synthase (precorrin-2 oxidase/ferrochelatase)
VTLTLIGYRPDDLDGIGIILITNIRDDTNIEITTATQGHNIPVNVPDKPDFQALISQP